MVKTCYAFQKPLANLNYYEIKCKLCGKIYHLTKTALYILHSIFSFIVITLTSKHFIKSQLQ